jgi:hypothetical protein
MKKFVKLITENLSPILVLLLISVIVLYILHFAEAFTDKAIKIITAFAAGTSTFFLYLAFTQNKKSNELKTQEHFYSELEKQVTNFENIAEKTVFVENNYLLDFYLPFPIELTGKIKYIYFIYPIKDIFLSLEKDSSYQYCLKKIGKETSVKLDDDYEVKEVLLVMSFLRDNFQKIFIFYIEALQIYERIDQIKLEEDLKKLLVARLDANMTEYFLLFNAQNEFESIYHFLLNFTFFKLDGRTLTKIDPGLILGFTPVYENIKKISEKYKDVSIKFDSLKAYRPKL